MTVVFGAFAILLTLLAALLVLSAGLFALSVVLSFSIAWYERINGDPTKAEERRHRFAAQLLLTEFVCLLVTLLLRPLGWLPPRIARVPARRTPVILLHGLFQNRSCLLVLHWRLRAAGFDRVVSVNTPAGHDLQALVDKVAATMEKVRTAAGAEQVHLVGHSMGGILARCYLQLQGGGPHVASCVTLGSPHRGSKLAPFAVSRLGRNLLPGSKLLSRLNAEPLPASVRFTAIYSRHDNIIVPMENARLDGANNIEFTGLGHTAMLFSAQVAEAVVTALQGQQPVTGYQKPATEPS
jgi:triacylglycerol esterase/lipase EstA (alpha/beta hydrolase family)